MMMKGAFYMNKMRLTRDKKWYFENYPYHQMRMDNELLSGWVSIIYLTDGETRYWEYEKAGRIPVCGKNMIWLTIIPDGKSRCIGTYLLPNRRVSTWYIDVIEEIGIDDDGILFYIDKYLDVMLTPQGDICVKDRDELDSAYQSGELSKKQYDDAILEGEKIIRQLASDIEKTEKYCIEILNRAETMIKDDVFTVFLDIDGVLDIYNPNKNIQELLPQAIDYLKTFVDRTMAKVVIASDWRYGASKYREKAIALGYNNQIALWNELSAAFKKYEITISDVTPWDENFKNRTEEIKQYLNMNPSIRRYVIFDDRYGDDYSSDKRIQEHLIFVDALKGLQIENVLQACRVMNNVSISDNSKL